MSQPPQQLPSELSQLLAEQLRDVHLPGDVGWWPLAAGWWVLLFCVLLALVSFGFLFYRRWRSKLYRKRAQQELSDAFADWQNEGQKNVYLSAANAILKRTVLSFDKESASSLSGLAWVESLNRLVKKPLSDATLNALAFECYKSAPSVDIGSLNVELIGWIKNHRSEPNPMNKFKQAAQREVNPHA